MKFAALMRDCLVLTDYMAKKNSAKESYFAQNLDRVVGVILEESVTLNLEDFFFLQIRVFCHIFAHNLQNTQHS
jgi:hypothetical protein